MQAVSPFFADLLSKTHPHYSKTSAKQRCLEYAAQCYGGQNVKLISLPIALQLYTDLQASFCPLLLQAEGDDQYYILSARGKKIYDGTSNRLMHSSQLNQLKLTHAWQCTPAGLPIISKLSQLFPTVLSNFRRDLIFAFILGCVVTIFSIMISMVSGYLVSHAHELAGGRCIPIFLSLTLVFLSATLMAYMEGIQQKMLNTKLLMFTLPSLWSHLLSLPLKSIQQFTTGDLSQKLFDYEIAMSSLLSTSLSILLYSVAILTLLAYMATCHANLALIYLIVCVVFTAVKFYYAPANMRSIHHMLAQQSRLTQYVNETLLQIHKIRSAGIEDKVFSCWLKNLVMVKSHAEQSLLIELLVMILESWIPITLLMTFYLALYFFPSTTDTGTLLQFMIVSAQFASLFDKLSSRLFLFIHFLPNLQRMEKIAELEPEKFDEHLHASAEMRGELALTNVSLFQAGGDQAVLCDLSLTFPAGKFIAIIGHSGAGKSSLFKLLLGFEKPARGTITIDHQPFSNFNISAIRKQFGVVLQTTNILPGTILSNLSAHRPLTHDEAWHLARLVGLDEEINAMPMKMHTYLSDNASESISGGQKQKILIARALAAHPKVLLLDEATSALDNHSQSLIFKNLEALQLTRVVIAHRYSTIVNADIIYCLEAGRLKDSGTYQELVSRGTIQPP